MPVASRLAQSAPPGHVARVRLVPRFGPPPPPQGGRERIAYYGFGYYLGLAGFFLFTFAICVYQSGWIGSHPAHNVWRGDSGYVERRALYNLLLNVIGILAANAFPLSSLERWRGGIKSDCGLWLNLALLLAWLVLSPFFAKGRAIA